GLLYWLLLFSLLVIAFLARDVLIPCNISGYNTLELDTTKMAVEWKRKTAEDIEEKVLFSLIADEQTSHRNGTRMNVDDLRKGSAALFLPEIQLNEEGTYQCVVTVTPDKAEATTTVELVAQPVVTLSPAEVTLERGQEITLTCAVKNFYPRSIEVYWEKYSKLTQHQSVSAADICTEASVENSDGTFSVTSKLRLLAFSENDGHTYSCIVKHKSFTVLSVFSAILTVKEKSCFCGNILQSYTGPGDMPCTQFIFVILLQLKTISIFCSVPQNVF
uniref:Ig-like domain-containing protein n=1 Tax=Salvator merianae TaxID=96440 RepID=A0A8D0CFG5_SALMN